MKILLGLQILTMFRIISLHIIKDERHNGRIIVFAFRD